MLFKFIHVFLLITLAVSVPFSACAGVSLKEVYQKALENDNTLKSAKFTYDAAKTYKYQGLSRLMPTASASVTEQHYDTDRYGEYKTRETRVDLNQPIFNMERYYGYKQSKHTVKSAKARYQGAESELIIRVVKAYVEVLTAMEKIELSKSRIESSTEHLTQAKKMYESGLVAITNVHDAQADLDMAEYEKIAAENEYANTLLGLEAITGKLDDAPDCAGTNFSILQADIGDIKDYIDSALKNNTEILRYKETINEARYTVKANKAKFLPYVDAFANYRRSNSVNEIRTSETVYRSVGARISLPIFSGGYNIAKVSESQSNYYKSVSDFHYIKIEVAKRTTESYNNLKGLQVRTKALSRLVESNKLALESNKKSLVAGVVTLVDVINAQNNLYNSRINLSQARYDYFVQYADLKYYAGMLSAKDIDYLGSFFDNTCEGTK